MPSWAVLEFEGYSVKIWLRWSAILEGTDSLDLNDYEKKEKYR